MVGKRFCPALFSCSKMICASTYVTLEDLAAMVKDGEDFLVYDAKTGDDITRSVLAQIIFEQENKAGQICCPPLSCGS